MGSGEIGTVVAQVILGEQVLARGIDYDCLLVTNALVGMGEVVPGGRHLRGEAIAAGGGVRLAFTDRGRGVPPEVRAWFWKK